MGTLFLGTQGFSYQDWVGNLYPAETQPADYLAHYVTHFRAVELDSTLYGTPGAPSIHTLYQSTPPDFIFTTRFPRAITHEKKLIGAEEDTRIFLETRGRLVQLNREESLDGHAVKAATSALSFKPITLLMVKKPSSPSPLPTWLRTKAGSRM